MDTRRLPQVTEDLQSTCFICGDTLETILKGNGDQSLKSFAIEHVLELRGNSLEGIWSEEKGDFGGDEEKSSGRRLELCAECADRVEEAKQLYLKLVEVVKKFRGIQREIVEDVRRRLSIEEVMDGKRSKWHQAIDEREFGFLEDFVVRPPEKWTLKKVSPSSVESVNESEPTQEEKEGDDSDEDDDEAPMSPLAKAEDAQDPLGIQIEAKTEEDEEGNAAEGIIMELEDGTPEPVKSEAEEDEEEEPEDSWEPSGDELSEGDNNCDSMSASSQNESDEDSTDEPPQKKTKRPKGSKEENCDSMSSPCSHSVSESDEDSTEGPPAKKRKGTKRKGKKCPVCGVHKATWYLPTHMLKMHGIQKDGKKISITQTCDICGESLPTSKMEAHLVEHVGSEYLRKCLNSWCTLVFPHQFALRKHLHTHKSCYYVVRPSKDSLSTSDQFLLKSRGKLRCSQCGVGLRSLEFLRSHLNTKHENCNASEQTLSCPMNQCLSIFRYKQSVEVHLALDHSHSSDLKATICAHGHPCVDCGPSQKVPFDQMETHLKTVHKAKEIINCTHCRYLFSSREHLINHTYDHHRKSISTYSCDICPSGDGEQQFSKANKWIEHYFEAHGIGRQYQCDQCPASFLQKRLLTTHKTGQHVSGKCDVCGETFSVAQLKYHKKVAHQEKSEERQETSKKGDWVAGEYKCDICDKPFQYLYVLQVHQKMEHEGGFRQTEEKEKKTDIPKPKPVNPCDICQMEFATAARLKRHKWQAHSDHRCPECQKEFKLEWELDEHKQIHTGPVTCPEPGCGKVSANARALYNHQKRMHEQQQKFICEDCGKGYTDNRNLKEHRILVHLGGHESSFPCQECGKDFKSKQRLNAHRYEAHLGGSKKGVFVCDECGQSFKHKVSLTRHKTQKHESKTD